MADKLTQQITDALSKAASDPAGLPLYAGKAEAGLFPATAAGRTAAQKCLADALLHAVRPDGGKAAREVFTLTDAGWDFLLAAVNPRQVLEDFVRVLEARQQEVGTLLDTARRMADSLHGLKDSVARVLPQVTAARVWEPNPAPVAETARRTEEGADVALSRSAEPTRVVSECRSARGTYPDAALAAAIRSHLADWSATATAGEDCTLPALFRRLAPAPTIGQFHDCLRELHADGSIYLHPWTGPLYAVPEPAFALLAGHGVAYYASLKSGQWAVNGGQSDRLAAADCSLSTAH